MAEADRIKWDQKYREREERGEARALPSSFLLALADQLPERGAALDLAGGSGRHALWLARRGLRVTLADVSPVALEQGAQAALEEDLSLTTLCTDLEQDSLPGGPWDLIVCFHYLQRTLFAQIPDALVPGGVLAFCQPTRSNLERHAHPSERFLLEDGELPGLVGDLEVVRYEEGWLDEGRHEARLLARRAAT